MQAGDAVGQMEAEARERFAAERPGVGRRPDQAGGDDAALVGVGELGLAGRGGDHQRAALARRLGLAAMRCREGRFAQDRQPVAGGDVVEMLQDRPGRFPETGREIELRGQPRGGGAGGEQTGEPRLAHGVDAAGELQAQRRLAVRVVVVAQGDVGHGMREAIELGAVRRLQEALADAIVRKGDVVAFDTQQPVRLQCVGRFVRGFAGL